MDNALIVVARKPVPGSTKTRLCPPLTPESAAEFYHRLLLDTLALMSRFGGADPVVAYTPSDAHAYFAALVPSGYRLIAQQGADLGERLRNALRHQFGLGYRRVAIMNSDGPTLPLACLEAAFSGLDGADVTLGPGHDGGYYLIGMKEPHAELFEQIAWSTKQVLEETLAACCRLGLTVQLLPQWYDVDVAADLERLRRDLIIDPSGAPQTWALLQRLPRS